MPIFLTRRALIRGLAGLGLMPGAALAQGATPVAAREGQLLVRRAALWPLGPGGRLLVLEFSQPGGLLRPFYYVYLKGILPGVAGIATGRRDAYEYLAGSVEQFPGKAALSEEFTRAGFVEVRATGLAGSIVAIHEATA